MNWRRGLFRIWIICAAAWLAGCLLVAYSLTGNPRFQLTPLGWLAFSLGALLTPLVVLGAAVIVGRVAHWVVEGFRKPL